MSLRAGAVVLAVSLAGCAHHHVTCPHEGGRPWLSVRTAHLNLVTDLPAGPATRIARESEAWIVPAAATARYFLPGGGAPGPTVMVMFAQHWEYDEVMSTDWKGVDLGGSVSSEEGPVIVAAADMHPADVFHHELARQLVKQRLGEVPRWLAEGLAEYFSQVGTTRDGKRVLGGPTWWLQMMMQNRANRTDGDVFELLPLADVLAERVPASRLDSWRMSGWALVHYLANGAADHAGRFRRFLRAVADRVAPLEALVQEYGTLPQLEAAYRAHACGFQQSNWLQWVIPIEPVSGEPGKSEVEELEDASVHFLMATLRPSNAPREFELARQHMRRTTTAPPGGSLSTHQKR